MTVRDKLDEKLRNEAVEDWQHSLGDSRALAARVLNRKLFNLNLPEVDKVLAEHYGLP